MRKPLVYVGTSGWNYAHWRSRFYPPGLRQGAWLRHLSRHLNSVELNTSFYRIPRREAVAEWRRQVRSGFRFAVKLWRGITHFRKLRGVREYLCNFFEVFEPLAAGQRGPLLVQLPPQQGKDVGKLDGFLAELREVVAPARWRVAVEFRNRDWLCDEVYGLLDRHRAAICLHDMLGSAPVHEPNGVSFVYVRRHGPRGDYTGSYGAAQLEADAARVKGWLAEGRTVFVYYNNDAEAHAVRNARRLLELLGVGETDRSRGGRR